MNSKKDEEAVLFQANLAGGNSTQIVIPGADENGIPYTDTAEEIGIMDSSDVTPRTSGTKLLTLPSTGFR